MACRNIAATQFCKQPSSHKECTDCSATWPQKFVTLSRSTRNGCMLFSCVNHLLQPNIKARLERARKDPHSKMGFLLYLPSHSLTFSSMNSKPFARSWFCQKKRERHVFAFSIIQNKHGKTCVLFSDVTHFIYSWRSVMPQYLFEALPPDVVLLQVLHAHHPPLWHSLMEEHNRPSTYFKHLSKSAEEDLSGVTRSKLHVSTASAAKKQCKSIFAPKGHCLHNILPHHLLLYHKPAHVAALDVRPAFHCNHVPACFGHSAHKQVTAWACPDQERGPALHVLLQEPILNWDCRPPPPHTSISGCTALVQSSPVCTQSSLITGQRSGHPWH